MLPFIKRFVILHTSVASYISLLIVLRGIVDDKAEDRPFKVAPLNRRSRPLGSELATFRELGGLQRAQSSLCSPSADYM